MRKKLTAFLTVTVLAATGFAAASIVGGGSLAAVLTGSTGTTGTSGTTGTTTLPGQRRVTICHRTGSRKHPGRTIRVSQNALAAHLRHGDHVGPCTRDEQPKPKKHDDAGSQAGKSGDGKGEHDKGHGNGK